MPNFCFLPISNAALTASSPALPICPALFATRAIPNPEAANFPPHAVIRILSAARPAPGIIPLNALPAPTKSPLAKYPTELARPATWDRIGISVVATVSIAMWAISQPDIPENIPEKLNPPPPEIPPILLTCAICFVVGTVSLTFDSHEEPLRLEARPVLPPDESD